ncbi:MAG: helix-turn-helix transcriptional regulator [Peptococcaceae bacterium]|nr:helix-turn-helix transcriptional regulator [Peptococcaceae bacterium]
MGNNNYRDHFIELGLNIKFYRNKKGLTQEQLADAVHISKQQISRIESPNNMHSTTLHTLYLIADALDVDIHLLIKSNR